MTDQPTKGRGGRPPGKPDAHELKRGAVVLIDALGFRGVWKKHNATLVLHRLHAVRRAIEEVAETVNETLAITTPVFLSDAILITVEADRGDDKTEALAIELAAGLALSAIEEAIAEQIEGVPAFTYRGCIAFGEVLPSGPFIVGPAIDEAAQWYEQAQAAVVWLLPSATRWIEHGETAAHLMKWDVPLKAHGTVTTTVVNPMESSRLIGSETPEKRRARMHERRNRMLRTFVSDDVGVVAKKQATARLLDAGMVICEREVLT
jgi:hypothetical protein